MAELLDEQSQLESTTVNVFRTASTVKGGRRFSFGALVVVGDRRGRVGHGHGKSTEVPNAIEKAQKKARRDMVTLHMAGTTIPHEVEGRFGASHVRLMPASPGTGVVAGATVRAVLELAGITDCLTKSFGSNNSVNVVKAVFDGIRQLQTRETIAELRGVDLGLSEIEQKIERGRRFMPTTSGDEEHKMRAPVNTVGQERGGGRGGRGGRGGPGGRGGRGGRAGGQGEAPSGTEGGTDTPAGN